MRHVGADTSRTVQRSRSAAAELTSPGRLTHRSAQRPPDARAPTGARRAGRCACGMAAAGSDGGSATSDQPGNSMRSSGRRGRFSARSASTTTCKPGVELSNTLDEDCTVIRRVARQRLRGRDMQRPHTLACDRRRGGARGREPAAQRWSGCRRPGQLCCGCALRRWPRVRALNCRNAAQSGVRRPCWTAAGPDGAPESAAGAPPVARRRKPRTHPPRRAHADPVFAPPWLPLAGPSDRMRRALRS